MSRFATTFYKHHIDNLLLSDRFEEVAQGVPTRDISIVGYLNDDFEGEKPFSIAKA